MLLDYHTSNLVHHIYQAHAPEPLRKILQHLPYLSWKLKQTSAVALAQDFDFLEEQPFRDIQRAIQLTGHIIEDDKAQLFVQLYAKLSDQSHNRTFRAKLEKCLSFFRPVFSSKALGRGHLARTLGTNATLFAYAETAEVLAVSDKRDTMLWDLRKGLVDPEPVFENIHAFNLGISSNGETVVAVDLQGRLHIRDRVSNRYQKLNQQGAQLIEVVVSTDGRYLAVSCIILGQGTAVTAWDVWNQEELFTDQTLIFPCVIKGHRLFAATRTGSLVVWDFAENCQRCVYQLGKEPILTLAVSPDETQMITSSRNSGVTLWSLPQCIRLAVFPNQTTPTMFVSVQPSWQHALIGFDFEEIGILDLQQKEVIRRWSIEEWPGFLYMADDNQTFYFIHSHNGEVQYFEPDASQSADVVNVGVAVAANPQESRVTVIDSEGILWHLDAKSGELLSQTEMLHRNAECAIFHPHKSEVFFGEELEHLVHHHRLDGKEIATYDEGFDSFVEDLVINARQHVLYIRTMAQLLARSLVDGRLLFQLQKPGFMGAKLALNPAATLLATSIELPNESMNVELLESLSGKRLATILVEDQIEELAFSPQGMYLMIGGYTGRVYQYSIHTGRLEGVYDAHRLAVNQILFLPDGQRFLSFGTDKRIYLWRLFESEPLDAFWYDESIFAATILPGLKKVFMATRGTGFGCFNYSLD